MLDAEMDHHLAQLDEAAAGNTRNGYDHKTVLTTTSAMPVDVPRDRRSTFVSLASLNVPLLAT